MSLLGFSAASAAGRKRKGVVGGSMGSESRAEIQSTTRITDIIEGAKIEPTQIERRTKFIK